MSVHIETRGKPHVALVLSVTMGFLYSLILATNLRHRGRSNSNCFPSDPSSSYIALKCLQTLSKGELVILHCRPASPSIHTPAGPSTQMHSGEEEGGGCPFSLTRLSGNNTEQFDLYSIGQHSVIQPHSAS